MATASLASRTCFISKLTTLESFERRLHLKKSSISSNRVEISLAIKDVGGANWSTIPRASTSLESAQSSDSDQVQEVHHLVTAGEAMTSENIITVKKTTTVDEALELLVENRITGMPVVEDDGTLVGVVSDYDLLALDDISGHRESSSDVFPQANKSWKAFREVQKLLTKNHGKSVADVMTPSPLCVRKMTNLEDAARLLLEFKFRRLPVVDDEGKLVGIVTRGNVIRVALEMKKAQEAASSN